MDYDQKTAVAAGHGRAWGNGAASLASLLDRYAGTIYWLAWHITADGKDAEDVLQQTFRRALSHLSQPHQDELSYTWLARIAVKEALAKLRDRTPGRLLSLNWEAAASEVPLPRQVVDWGEHWKERYTGEELRGIVHEAIQGLTPASGLVLVLHDMAGLRSEEIAHLLAVSVAETKSWLLRGWLQLREHLNEYFKPTFNQGTPIE